MLELTIPKVHNKLITKLRKVNKIWFPIGMLGIIMFINPIFSQPIELIVDLMVLFGGVWSSIKYGSITAPFRWWK